MCDCWVVCVCHSRMPRLAFVIQSLQESKSKMKSTMASVKLFLVRWTATTMAMMMMIVKEDVFVSNRDCEIWAMVSSNEFDFEFLHVPRMRCCCYCCCQIEVEVCVFSFCCKG